MFIHLFIFLLSLKSFSQDVVSECTKDRGEIKSSWVCPDDDKVRKGTFCFLKDKYQNELVYNGCSGGDPRYNKIFFKSCKSHDLCYHHEPITSGLSKANCDLIFLENMNSRCQLESDVDKCEKMAKIYYRAVQVFGINSWKCSKQFADYFIFLY